MEHTKYRIVESNSPQTERPRCSVCNSTLIVNKGRSGKYKYYVCLNRHRETTTTTTTTTTCDEK
jgi:hypothetical protein